MRRWSVATILTGLYSFMTDTAHTTGERAQPCPQLCMMRHARKLTRTCAAGEHVF